MAYARIPDELVADDRYLEAVDTHPAAGTLVLFGYSYSAREETDGFVPVRQLRRWLSDVKATEAAVDALVAAGLWERRADGVQMLDYIHGREGKRNLTRAEWAEKRERERIRKAEWRAAQVEERRQADAGPASDVPRLSQRDTRGTDAGQDAGRTPDEQRPSAGTPAARPTTSSDEAHPQLENAQRAMRAAGFADDAVSAAATRIHQALRDRDAEPRLPRPDWSSFSWPALGDWLAEERRAKRAKSQKVDGVLRFGLFATSQPGTPRPAGARRPAAAPAPPSIRNVKLPPPTDAARAAWGELREALEDVSGMERLGSIVEAIRPLAVKGSVLELTSTPSAVVQAERFVMPQLVALARQRSAQVRFVLPDEAAARGAAA